MLFIMKNDKNNYNNKKNSIMNLMKNDYNFILIYIFKLKQNYLIYISNLIADLNIIKKNNLIYINNNNKKKK